MALGALDYQILTNMVILSAETLRSTPDAFKHIQVTCARNWPSESFAHWESFTQPLLDLQGLSQQELRYPDQGSRLGALRPVVRQQA